MKPEFTVRFGLKGMGVAPAGFYMENTGHHHILIDMDLSESPLKDRPLEGFIGFQDEAQRVWYRNVRIKELK